MSEIGKVIEVAETKMKRFKFSLCILDEDDNILKKYGINTTWNAVDEGFIGENFDIRMENEIANIISAELKKGINPEVIKELMKGVT